MYIRVAKALAPGELFEFDEIFLGALEDLGEELRCIQAGTTTCTVAASMD